MKYPCIDEDSVNDSVCIANVAILYDTPTRTAIASYSHCVSHTIYNEHFMQATS